MEKKGCILIVDDDDLILETLNELFVDDYDITSASSGTGAIEIIKDKSSFDALILDIKMAQMDGLETASHIKEIDPDLPIIFFTGYPGDYSERQIEKDYQPFDYVVKNERPERLQRAVRNAVKFHRNIKKPANLVEFARANYRMVGQSAVMQEIYRKIEKIAPTNSKVMIVGPTGCGKELVARAIYKRSKRADKRMGVLHCNHKQPDLVESELFGHLKGSFTGAVEDRVGMFEYADGGTLFLDEIGDLDFTTQAKLLRVLESGEIHRLGSSEIIYVDVRVICATNRNLEQMVSEDKFREDLYYRLKGVTISIPPLKDRREDIPLFIDYVIEKYAMESGEGLKVFEPAARDLLIEYDWPGNARQLVYTIQALMDLSNSSFISRKDVEKYLSFSGKLPDESFGFNAQLKEMKKLIIIKALSQTEFNVAAAARILSLDRSNLFKMIKELGIKTG